MHLGILLESFHARWNLQLAHGQGQSVAAGLILEYLGTLRVKDIVPNIQILYLF